MADWFACPITVRPGEESTTYAWAGRTGRHFTSEPPEHVIPTGHIWAWGGNDWAAWREETNRCADLWLHRVDVTSGDNWKSAITDVPGPPREGALLSPRRNKRFFRNGDGNANWHGLPAYVLQATVLARTDLPNYPEAARR